MRMDKTWGKISFPHEVKYMLTIYWSWPADLSRLENAKVVYHEMEGWMKPTTEARSYYDLPKQARAYIEYIEEFVGVKVSSTQDFP